MNIHQIRAKIDVAEARTLKKLNDFLISLRTRINSGESLMGLGAAIVAIEVLLEEGEIPDDNWPTGTTNVSIDFEQGDRNFREGHNYTLESTSEGICLDHLYRSYTSEYESDHHSTTIAELSPACGFDDDAVYEWLRKAKDILQFEDARLSASVDVW